MDCDKGHTQVLSCHYHHGLGAVTHAGFKEFGVSRK